MFSTQSSSTASTSQLQTPPPAMTHVQSNIVDDFFGGSTSRHDRPLSGAHSEMTMPPPYVGEDNDLPAYSRTAAEPVTLAMFLFKFGFLLPPFWLLGAFILLSPLRAPPSRVEEDGMPAAWLPEKTEAERQAIIDRMRTVEVKWARRCLWAILVLLLILAIGTLAAVMLLRS